MVRFIGSLLFFVSAVVGLPFLYNLSSCGFRIGKLADIHSFNKGYEYFPLCSEKREILSQPYKYMARGTQCFVFESLDGKYVLKFFLHQKNLDVLEKTAKACQIAYKLLAQETGLLYIHLTEAKGDLPTISIQDPLYRSQTIDLNRFAFILQKKAKPFRPTFLLACKEGRGEELIASYLRLAWNRSQKGIHNRDITLSRNVGFIDSKAVEIDVGSYIQDRIDNRVEFKRSAEKIGAFLKKYHPQLVEEYEHQMSSFDFSSQEEASLIP